MAQMGVVLKDHIIKHKLYTNIKGKNYAHVEGWTFAGGLMGLFPVVKEVINLSGGTETKWEAVVEIVGKDGRVMSRGFAVCSSKESSKRGFDEYAIMSMAQTRAIGKAYRNLVGWVMKLAGYEGTPSEEMRKVDETPKDPQQESGETPQEHFEDHVCQTLAKGGCGKDLTIAEASYSMNMFGRELCREHQKGAKRK
jgi:hypothetical protein